MLMDILSAYMDRVGIDSNFSDIRESSEDYIDVTDPDLDFGEVREKILSNVVLSRRLTDQTVASVELFDTIWLDGNKVNVLVLFEIGSLGFGTRAKVTVKTVDVLVGGNVKSFLGISAYKNYINSKEIVGA